MIFTLKRQHAVSMITLVRTAILTVALIKSDKVDFNQ